MIQSKHCQSTNVVRNALQKHNQNRKCKIARGILPKQIDAERIVDDVQEIEIDQMWHYVSKNLKALGAQGSRSW